MSGAIWTGFTSLPWNPDQLRAEREAWEAKHLPSLRAKRAEQMARRQRGRDALNSLPGDTRAAIVAAYGAPL